ncbi:MAG: hypothetical protein VZR09_01240 [Candidatus Gastranaerophilaceae bacterium]|nr:hypothetical protein [Candidatus Gastranaerophilaceae bacterium]
MAIQAIKAADLNAKKNNNLGTVAKQSAQPSFQGLEQVPVAVADALTNGGFITSFIAQDFFGMAGPRVLEGINRRPVNKETGKKEGPYNWAFARREGIREILSGPSAFIIPAILLHFIKKYSGTANNVPINMIQGLGNNFIDYAAKNPDTLDNVAKTKTEFYNNVFKNVLNTTLEGNVPEAKIDELAKDYAARAIEIEQAKGNKKSLWKKITNQKVAGSPEDLTDSLLNDFMKLKKQHLNPSANELTIEMVINPKKFGLSGSNLEEADKTSVSFKKLLTTMTDFTDDVIDTTGKALKKYKNQKFDPERFLKTFVDKRTGSRILSNMGMWSAVVGFYALIPKLYSLGLKGQNPAFAHEHRAKIQSEEKLSDAAENTSNGKNVSFSGREKVFTNTAEYVLNSSKLKKFLNHFEFDDASMSVSAMMALLYGFCLPTRLLNAPDKYDRKETITRDITSFGAILFAAQALSRGFSKIFSNISGLALNHTPSDHNKNFYTRFIRDYFSPVSGINVFTNKELESKYTYINEFKGGVNGFFDFITDNGGNLKKLLMRDKSEAMTDSLKTILGKDLKDVVNDDEIKNAFKNITNADEAKTNALKTFENIFKDSKNKFVKSAKVYNSMFTFLSTIFIVPSFMIWLARTCDKMTRTARAKDLELKKQQNAKLNIVSDAQAQNAINMPATKITMQGFLSK